MPRAKINYVVSFSSEDPEHPASNLLANEVSKKRWLCSKGETSCSVVLQLVRSVQISAVHIGAHHAALVEILVGRSESSNEPFKVLVPSSIFVNPSDSRRGEGVERVRSFSADQLSADTRSQKWDRVRVVCSQPYNKHCKYGLSFIHIFEPEGKDIPTATVPTRLLTLDTRSSHEDDSFKPGELFAKYMQKKAGLDGKIETSTNKHSTETQIRKATSQALQHNSDTSSQLVKTPISKEKIKDKPSSSKERDRSNRETEGNRDRNTLLYDKDDEKPHSKIDQVVQRHKNEKSKRESDSKSRDKHRHRSKSKESDHRKSKDSKHAKDHKESSKSQVRNESRTSKDRKDSCKDNSKESVRGDTKEKDECRSKEKDEHRAKDEEKRKKMEHNISKESSRVKSKEKDERRTKDEDNRQKMEHNRSKESSRHRSKDKDERRSKDAEKSKKGEHHRSKESSGHRSKEKDECRSKDEGKRKKEDHNRSKDGSHNSSKESKRRHSSDRSLEKESKRFKAGPVSSSPHNLMSGVVFTLSGYENPRRALVRDKALAMGAKFQREWDNRCTHLICAFPNTPKLRTVRSQPNGASIVVTTAEWIEQCCASRRLLPWQWFATEPKFKVARPEGDGGDEDLETTVVESECDTDDEIEKVLNQQKRNSRANTSHGSRNSLSPSTSKDKPNRRSESGDVIQKDKSRQENGLSNGVDSYDYATDEEEKRRCPMEVDDNATLPDFFEGLTFAIEETVSEVGFDRQQLKRYAWAYGGEVLELSKIDEASEVDYVLTNRQSSIQGLSVRPDWIWRCHEKQRLCSVDAYLIT